jgi:type III secretory pathway component EscS
MDKITRYEWHGSALVLVLLWILGITIPFAVVYLMTNLLRIETQVADGTRLSEFLRARK